MIICKLKIDKRGRISLPVNFLRANNIKLEDAYVRVHLVAGRDDAIKIQFEKENK
jgi:hypothetical protein